MSVILVSRPVHFRKSGVTSAFDSGYERAGRAYVGEIRTRDRTAEMLTTPVMPKGQKAG